MAALRIPGRGRRSRRHAVEAARAVLENTAALMVVLDGEGRILLWNRACEQVLGWPAAEVLGRPFHEVFVHPDDAPYAKQGVQRQMATGRAEPREGSAVTRDGAVHRLSWHNTVLRDHRGRPDRVACVGIDVTEQRRAEDRLRELAETDPLTGLLNRTSLLHALEERDALGVLYCDLDGFKAVNDRLGHAAGDELLVQVAERLRGAVRDGDLVARMGGDEFVVLCPMTNGTDLDRLAARVAEAVQAPCRLACGSARVGISVGVAVRQPDEPPHAVLAAADAEMYAVKVGRRASR